MKYQPTEFRSLLKEMVVQCGDNVSELARRFQRTNGGVTERSLRKWLGKDDAELAAIRQQSVDPVFRLAKEMGIEVERFIRPAKLWEWGMTYSDNVAYVPPPNPILGAPLRNHKTPFLGRKLLSPFGISASVLTSTTQRVRYFAHTGCDIITLKTVRSRTFPAHDTPNVMFCADVPLHVSPDEPLPSVSLRDADDTSRAAAGMVNHFGVPSPPPEEWQATFKSSKALMRNPERQLLIQSIIGTGDKRERLIEDFVLTSAQASDAGADVQEVNASCPNADNLEGRVYHDPKLSRDIVRRIREAQPHLKLVFKIGYLRNDELRRLVVAIAEYVDAIAVINTYAVGGSRRGQRGPVPAFNGLQAGLSGDPIRSLGLRATGDLRSILVAEKLEHLGIIGIGGVTSPEHVEQYRSSGADVVQATTAFFDDAAFGLTVRRFLDKGLQGSTRQTDIEEFAIPNAFAAFDELAATGDVPGLTRTALYRALTDFHLELVAAETGGQSRSEARSDSSKSAFKRRIIQAARQ